MILIMRKIYLKLIVLFYVLCCNTSKKKCPNCKGSGTVKSYDNGRSVRVKCTVEHNGYDASVGGYFIYEYKSGLKCENCGEEYSR